MDASTIHSLAFACYLPCLRMCKAGLTSRLCQSVSRSENASHRQYVGCIAREVTSCLLAPPNLAPEEQTLWERSSHKCGTCWIPRKCILSEKELSRQRVNL